MNGRFLRIAAVEYVAADRTSFPVERRSFDYAAYGSAQDDTPPVKCCFDGN